MPCYEAGLCIKTKTKLACIEKDACTAAFTDSHFVALLISVVGWQKNATSPWVYTEPIDLTRVVGSKRSGLDLHVSSVKYACEGQMCAQLGPMTEVFDIICLGTTTNLKKPNH